MSKRLKRLVAAFLALCVLLSALYLFRAPLLRGAASAWIVNEPLVHADAIVVLGGGLETRPFEAARLYKQNYAHKILIMNVRLSPSTELGITLPEKDLTRQVLVKLGVPDSDVVDLGTGVASTFDESMAVRTWTRTNAVKSLIIPTDLFHTHRVRWLFRKQLKPTGVAVIVESVAARDYNAANWWHHEDGLIAFESEVIKFAYYRFKY
jgi:uncharacterized SAM-binding protein YcdF (DUF218 family)